MIVIKRIYVLKRYKSVLFKHLQSNSLSTINKILIANRGEIACRVIRTAKKIGVKTVAVYSDVDKESLHVQQADEAYCIGSGKSLESYLSANKIIDAAKKSECQAIHPGYGFLSENPEFADLCEKENLIFIGPPASAIRDMGIKSKSKLMMKEGNVPVIEGYNGADQTYERLFSEAKKIGFPLMIKAIRGGGGKGMRIVYSEDEFESGLKSTKLESFKCFGDDNVLIEKFISSPRHVEVQVFADKYGNIVYLFERDCSVQRRHQKIIEEAPAPGISEDLRRKLGETAVQAAKVVKYVGAGTVEFILNKDTLEYHFMEMNTRLQVEHPITEMITGLDLVEWQINIASGLELPLTQDQIKLKGHSFEGRIYAEDTQNNFMPCTGTLKYLSTPSDLKNNVRVEIGVKQNDEISVHYDPMIAKLVVWDEDRTKALKKLQENLNNFNVVGVETNINFLLSLTNNKEFQLGNVHTNFIEENSSSLFKVSEILSHEEIAQAILATILKDKEETLRIDETTSTNPFVIESNFRVNHKLIKKFKLKLKTSDKDVEISVKYLDRNNYQISYDNEFEWFDLNGRLIKIEQDEFLECYFNNKRTTVKIFMDHQLNNDQSKLINFFTKNGHLEIEIRNSLYYDSSIVELEDGNVSHGNSIVAPMSGIIEKINVKNGDKVKIGDTLFVIIAMKMEYNVKSHKDGVVGKINKNLNDFVNKNDTLAIFE